MMYDVSVFSWLACYFLIIFVAWFDILLPGEYPRLFAESDPGVEIPVACADRKAHGTHISSPVSGA